METLKLTSNFQLSYHWEAGRESLRASQTYQTLHERVRSPVLLAPRFFALVTEIVNLQKSIEEQCVKRDLSVALGKGDEAQIEAAIKEQLKFHSPWSHAPDAARAEVARLVASQLKLKPSEAWQDPKRAEKEARKGCRQARQTILRFSKRMRQLEVQLRSRIPSLETVVDGLTLYPCKCGDFVLNQDKACGTCGGKPKGDPLSMARCDPVLVQLVAQRVWLEIAVSNLFRENGFETIVGAHVHGPSGVDHEMDVIAYDTRNQLSASVEVTAGSGTLSQLQEVMLRKAEFPFQNFLLVTLGPADPKAVEYGRTHGVWVFGDVRKSQQHLANWIRDYRKHSGRLLKAATLPR